MDPGFDGIVISIIMLTLAAVILGSTAISSFPNDGTEPSTAKPTRKMVVGYVQDEDDTPNVADLIDYSKVTHVNIAFSNPTNANGDLAITPHLDQIVDRAHKSKVKVLISIGGGSASEGKAERDQYFDLISDAKRAFFVAKLLKYVGDHHLDGLDVDLEGPAINKDYGAFVNDLSAAFKPKGLLLTAAVSVGYGGGQIPDATLSLFDLINTMAYDETGPWNPDKAGQHSSMDLAKANTTYWLGRGVAKSKLVLGVPFYGYGFGDAFTKDGYTYAQIVDKFPGAELLDQVGKTIWYNGIPTIQAKTQFVLDQGLGGVMIWSLNQDAKGKQSLLAAINQTLTAKN